MSGDGEAFRLIQPGLMTMEEMSEILCQRGISIQENKNITKYDLVELYRKHAMPLSQRTFPNSHRGILINKKINEENKRRGATGSSSVNNFQIGFRDKPSSSTKHHMSPERSRLKPPIDSGSPSSKKICLKAPSTNMDNIVINKRSKSSSKDSNIDPDKAVKRPAEKTSPEKNQSSKESEKKDEPSSKRKKIAWP